MEFIRETTLVHLKIRCWSGEVKAQKTDITLGQGGSIPPKQLLELGRKKIFPPQALQPLKNLRKAAERACLAVGTRFMGGYAVPDDSIETLEKELKDIEHAYDVAQRKFESTFEANKQAWMKDNLEYTHLFNALPCIEDVRGSFSYSFGCYKLNPIDGHEPDMEEVADQVLHEMSMYCKNLSAGLVKRKTATSGKSLRKLLSPVVERLNALSFGNGRIIKVLNEFNELVDSVPDTRITKKDLVFRNAVMFLSMCANPDQLETIIKGQFSIGTLINSIGVEKEELDKQQSQSAVIQNQSSDSQTSGAYF